mmetsp:Transcript_11376/g.15497  ORF Transcript_11376/g.15497 Transcript_11376/m.15497 type:complete len:180 (+) Transcript_11376:78-617(+)
MHKESVFLTVGTTSFDSLIRQVDRPEFVEILRNLGYTSLVLQIGRGEYRPVNIIPPGEISHKDAFGFCTEFFKFAPALNKYVNAASMVISHAGSGSIFETLNASKPLVVVVNSTLMDNHQQELADELSSNKYCISTTPEKILQTLQNFDPHQLVAYSPGNPSKVCEAIDDILGVQLKQS